jgi:hypothetical protein
MLELSKDILRKVSFDKALFKKELIKSITWIHPSEKMLFQVWCLATFGNQYKNEILEIFSKTW